MITQSFRWEFPPSVSETAHKRACSASLCTGLLPCRRSTARLLRPCTWSECHTMYLVACYVAVFGGPAVRGGGINGGVVEAGVARSIDIFDIFY